MEIANQFGEMFVQEETSKEIVVLFVQRSKDSQLTRPHRVH